jgi:hypothetical protein
MTSGRDVSTNSLQIRFIPNFVLEPKIEFRRGSADDPVVYPVVSLSLKEDIVSGPKIEIRRGADGSVVSLTLKEARESLIPMVEKGEGILREMEERIKAVEAMSPSDIHAKLEAHGMFPGCMVRGIHILSDVLAEARQIIYGGLPICGEKAKRLSMIIIPYLMYSPLQDEEDEEESQCL